MEKSLKNVFVPLMKCCLHILADFAGVHSEVKHLSTKYDLICVGRLSTVFVFRDLGDPMKGRFIFFPFGVVCTPCNLTISRHFNDWNGMLKCVVDTIEHDDSMNTPESLVLFHSSAVASCEWPQVTEIHGCASVRIPQVRIEIRPIRQCLQTSINWVVRHGMMGS